jgi:hypothetical protein
MSRLLETKRSSGTNKPSKIKAINVRKVLMKNSSHNGTSESLKTKP